MEKAASHCRPERPCDRRALTRSRQRLQSLERVRIPSDPQIKAAAWSFGLLRPCSQRSRVLGWTPILKRHGSRFKVSLPTRCSPIASLPTRTRERGCAPSGLPGGSPCRPPVPFACSPWFTSFSTAVVCPALVLRFQSRLQHAPFRRGNPAAIVTPFVTRTSVLWLHVTE
jgi:hypothetical protein